MDAISFFNTIMAMSGMTIILSEWLSKYTKVDGKWSRLQSWVVAILISIFATWINIGIFKEMDWKGGLVVGLIISFVSNGIFDIDMIKRLLETFKVRYVKDDKVESING